MVLAKAVFRDFLVKQVLLSDAFVYLSHLNMEHQSTSFLVVGTYGTEWTDLHAHFLPVVDLITVMFSWAVAVGYKVLISLAV